MQAQCCAVRRVRNKSNLISHKTGARRGHGGQQHQLTQLLNCMLTKMEVPDQMVAISITPVIQDLAQELSSTQSATASSSLQLPETAPAGEEDSDCYICAVCSKPCTKYLYYGARACLGCRAFFRRARSDKRHETFVCVTGRGDCPMFNAGGKLGTSGGGTICAFCRHEKCLKVGMNPAWMLSDDDRKERKRRRIAASASGGGRGRTVKKEEAKARTGFKGTAAAAAAARQKAVVIPRAPDVVFTAEELLKVQRIISRVNDIFLDTMTSNLLVYRETGRAVFEMSVYGTTKGPDFIVQFEKLKMDVIATICQKFQDFSSIDPLDRRRLVEQNFPSLFSLMAANYFHPEGFRVFCGRILGRLKQRQSENEIFERIAGNLEVLQVSGVPIVLNYDQVFASPWLSSREKEARHAHLFERIRVWGRETPEKIRDTVMLVLLYLICITDPASCHTDLKDRETVEQVYDGYLTLLCRYLRWSYGGDGARTLLGGGISMLSLAREAYHIMEEGVSIRKELKKRREQEGEMSQEEHVQWRLPESLRAVSGPSSSPSSLLPDPISIFTPAVGLSGSSSSASLPSAPILCTAPNLDGFGAVSPHPVIPAGLLNLPSEVMFQSVQDKRQDGDDDDAGRQQQAAISSPRTTREDLASKLDFTFL